MAPWIVWVLFGVPLAAIVFAWVRLFSKCKNEINVWSVIAMLLATSSTVLANGSFAYVELVKPFAARDYTVEVTGLLLSIPAVISGLLWTNASRSLNSLIAAAVSGWMFMLYMLMAATY